MDTLRSESSAWLYRYERNAIVVTVPMTAATTAISATAETTSRVRSDHGPRIRDDEVLDDGVRDGRVGRVGRVCGRRLRDDRVGDGRSRCPAPLTTGRYSPGLMR
ncbi:hypothetical protein [Streptomyces sp. CB02009]|uniref:hypothetical protein n=1 Tax=Streptomyces sp. CB02009 TaxID=1703938 RepID=UPI001F51F7EC|nr:hypothetical protein [Streptomyces sp. CB02009]